MTRTAFLIPLLAACGTPSVDQAVAQADPPGSTAIGIHGAWTLEVRDPDGSVVEHVAFHNDYVSNDVLPRILTRELTTGYWKVLLSGPDPDFESPCNDGTGPQHCVLTELGAVAPGAFPLAIAAGDDLVTLSGSATALDDGTIHQVATNITWCDPDTPPDTCTGGVQSALFTTTILPSDLTLLQNQSVYVTVEISFANLP